MPAAGIISSVADMTKWVIMHLNNGKYGDEQCQAATARRGLTGRCGHRRPSSRSEGAGPYNSHFAAYGLGWGLTDVSGYLQASHTGGLAGIVTQVTIDPGTETGNHRLHQPAGRGSAFTAITNTIKDGYLGITGNDWVKTLQGKC
ncbi:MAG: beta-lactamase family protein [Marinilabiliales bacterium]|nr:beta-lactamase family protein [Marinilabiliales bacterium]